MDVKCSVENVSVCACEAKAGWTVRCNGALVNVKCSVENVSVCACEVKA